MKQWLVFLKLSPVINACAFPEIDTVVVRVPAETIGEAKAKARAEVIRQVENDARWEAQELA